MNYKHDDGAYSAFGNSDSEGSTWCEIECYSIFVCAQFPLFTPLLTCSRLTAFVIRSFHQAMKYITIDVTHLEQAIKWLIAHQYDSGDFQEPGRVIHTEMQVSAAPLLLFAFGLDSIEY